MSRFEDQANYYKNLHLRDRSIKAVVLLENKDDKRFWNFQLQNIQSGHYHFISHSRNENEIESNGCEQCLKFRPYINRHFFICIDSDLRLLRGEENINPDVHIAQTYTYSWENHSCELEHLETRFKKKISDIDFSIASFLKELTFILYRPLLYLVHYNTPELNLKWNISKFNKCLPTQLKRDEFENNGYPYLQKVRLLFDSELTSLTLPDNFFITGLTEENAYLHIQGHKLYKLILYIGTQLCKGKRIAFKSEILDNDFPISGYKEIDSVQKDLRTILRV